MTNEDESKQRRARCIWTIAFVLWICVVWGHSLVPGEASTLESDRMLDVVHPFLTFLGFSDKYLMTFAIRKTAHFLEYAILMTLGRAMTLSWLGRTPRGIWCTVAIFVLVPCVDESLQLVTIGRTAKIADVVLDMAGESVGLLVLWLTCKWRRKRASSA